MPEPKMRLGSLFAVPLAEVRLPEPGRLNRELTELFLRCESEGGRFRNRIRRDTQKGELFESRFDLFDWDEPPVKELAAFCHGGMMSALHATSDYSEQELEGLGFGYHAWFHVTRAGGYQGMHNHSNASWSGIYCVDPGDAVAERPESGAVRFHDTRTNGNYYADAGNARLKMPFHMGSFQVEHEPGKLFIFPSYVLHEVHPYVGEKPRIVVAFNCWIRRKETKQVEQ